MAKRIRVSDDDGSTWYTLPGSSGEFSSEMAQVDDTIFGQDYQSESPAIGMWQVTANAYMKGIAGYVVKVMSGGTPVSTTSEATTLVSGKTYQVTDVAKRNISYAGAVVVNDDGSPVATSDILSIDYLQGMVTFVASYTPAAAITLDYDYVPTAVIGKARSYQLTQQQAEIDNTDYATALANDGWRTHEGGLKTVNIEIGNIWNAANDFVDILANRAQVFIEVSPNNTLAGGTSEIAYKGFFKYQTQGQSGNVGALEEESLTLNLFVPNSEVLSSPFTWIFGSAANISQAVKICLTAFINGTPIMVQYSPDGTNGKEGDCIVTEASLSGTFEGQNEFSFTFRGSGAPADI